ncbi:hypothetical protein MMC16_005851 [Acarospora aff. strigata]|nr:hypothetical protein [Acarospora aff. strigata]
MGYITSSVVAVPSPDLECKSEAQSQPRPFKFLQLPGEVRNMIYPLLLIRGDSCSSSLNISGDRKDEEIANETTEAKEKRNTRAAGEDDQQKCLEPNGLHPAILLTNRLINTEATPLLYAHNTLTATITPSNIISLTNSISLLSSSPHLLYTRSWIITINLLADSSLPSRWEDEPNWEITIAEAHQLVNDIMTRLREACSVLAGLPDLERMRIEVVGGYHWEVRERLAGVGLAELFDEFVGLRVKEVEIVGAKKLVRDRKIEEVSAAMVGV